MQTQILSERTKKVHLITLGCARNRVDAEVMLGSLFEKGWEMTQQPDNAQAIVVNTCGFIDKAKEESIDRILEMAEYKKSNPAMKLLVTGCLTQRYKTQLVKSLPEVDLFIGVDEFSKISDLITSDNQEKVHAKRTHYIYNEYLPRTNTLNKASAYVKVAEGCQHSCSFCIIPAIRGKLRSRPIASVVQEVKKLVAQGVLEVNLIAQDLAAYGRDLDQDLLLSLLKELVKIDGLQWVRLLYMYPENISDEFLDFMANESKLVKYLDIPIQHASDKLLQSMNRNVTQARLKSILSRVRQRIPSIAIRTTVMVGYPGETTDDFNQLKDFVSGQEFAHLGCFTYSKEVGTVAARLGGQVDEDIKVQRQSEIMTIQKGISKEKMSREVGSTQQIIVEGVSPEHDSIVQGRLSTQAPEVDGVVVFEGEQPTPGQIVQGRVVNHADYDLVATLEVPHE